MAQFMFPTKQHISGQRVLLRVDWNVPLNPKGEILDPFRIEACLPTLLELRALGAKQIILLTHMGNPVVRPRDKFERTLAGNQRLVLAPLAKYLHSYIKSSAELRYEEIPGFSLPGYQIADDIILVENLRFHPGELTNDKDFAKQLATLGDVMVNEAFSESHRSAASMDQLSTLLPTFAGRRLLLELEYLDRFGHKDEKPLVFVLGGAKVHDKILLIDNLLKKVDAFLLGGVMANTFLAAQGIDMRRSLVETDRLEAAKELFNRAPQKFIMPLDFTWDRDRVLDIGPQTVALFEKYFAKAKLIFWNGPMGWTDSGRDRFMQGTRAVAEAVGASSATSIAAGGDTLAIIDNEKLADSFTFLSTGGGASLAYLSGADMPGLTHLQLT